MGSEEELAEMVALLRSIIDTSPKVDIEAAPEALSVKKQARQRAVTKEDERRERISTTVQTAAVQQQHSMEMEVKGVTALRIQSAVSEKSGLTGKLVEAEERQLELEAKVRGLKAVMVDAQTNAEQLEGMSRA
eukprot:g15650.t1